MEVSLFPLRLYLCEEGLLSVSLGWPGKLQLVLIFWGWNTLTELDITGPAHMAHVPDYVLYVLF